MKRFYYHYNRPNDCWSIHFNKKCILADHLQCTKTVESKNNKTQPRKVMQGFCNFVNLETLPSGETIAKIL